VRTEVRGGGDERHGLHVEMHARVFLVLEVAHWSGLPSHADESKHASTDLQSASPWQAVSALSAQAVALSRQVAHAADGSWPLQKVLPHWALHVPGDWQTQSPNAWS
jgi:hypothetical protein